MHLPSVLFPAFSVASPVTIELGGKQYIRHVGGSRYPIACKAHHFGFGLASGSWPGMTKFVVFFRRINNRDSRDTKSRDTCDLSPPWLCAFLLIASGSMKRPTDSQPGGIISCVSKGISCP